MNGSSAKSQESACNPNNCNCCVEGVCKAYPNCNLLEFTLLVLCGVIALTLVVLIVLICIKKKRQKDNQVAAATTHARRNLSRANGVGSQQRSANPSRNGITTPLREDNGFGLAESARMSSFEATARNQELSSTVNQDGAVVFKRRVTKGVADRDIPVAVSYHQVPKKLYRLPSAKTDSGLGKKAIILLGLDKTKPEIRTKAISKQKEVGGKIDDEATVESEVGLIKNVIVPAQNQSNTPRKQHRPGSGGNGGFSDIRLDDFPVKPSSSRLKLPPIEALSTRLPIEVTKNQYGTPKRTASPKLDLSNS